MMTSTEIDALCDRFNGDRNLLINEHHLENVSKIGKDIKRAFPELFLEEISGIRKLAELWCEAKHLKFSSVRRMDRVFFKNCRTKMKVFWQDMHLIIFDVNLDEKLIRMRLENPTSHLNPTWRLYEYQINGGEVLLGSVK